MEEHGDDDTLQGKGEGVKAAAAMLKMLRSKL
jgi:hypothetical protein